MKILVLGTGMQGKAALYDLVHSSEVTHVVAADADVESVNEYVSTLATDKVKVVSADASDLSRVSSLMEQVDAAIVLLPPSLTEATVGAALEAGCHWIDASYSLPGYKGFDAAAKAKGIAILPELGLDPGIDLVLAAAALSELDRVDKFNSYGAGFPEADAANNAIKYKISWTLAGVLRAYNRPARIVQRGRVVDIGPGDVFAPEHVHLVDLAGIGELEAYPNGDTLKYLELLDVAGQVGEAGRFSMRWPGHAAFWRVMQRLGFLSSDKISVGPAVIEPVKFVHDLLYPQLQYGENERDVAVVLVDATGIKNGRHRRVMYRVIDRRDLGSGLLAMQRTVGFSASIGAQMILNGDITGRGLLSPLRDIPAESFFSELAKRGIVVERQIKE